MRSSETTEHATETQSLGSAWLHSYYLLASSERALGCLLLCALAAWLPALCSWPMTTATLHLGRGLGASAEWVWLPQSGLGWTGVPCSLSEQGIMVGIPHFSGQLQRDKPFTHPWSRYIAHPSTEVEGCPLSMGWGDEAWKGERPGLTSLPQQSHSSHQAHVHTPFDPEQTLAHKGHGTGPASIPTSVLPWPALCQGSPFLPPTFWGLSYVHLLWPALVILHGQALR